ncbi:hypothetical protein L195_g064489, partial [Trifolium pratense]
LHPPSLQSTTPSPSFHNREDQIEIAIAIVPPELFTDILSFLPVPSLLRSDRLQNHFVP